MLKVYQKTARGELDTDVISDNLWLDFDRRKLGRLKATTESGQDIGLFLERGEILRDGQLLTSECGTIIRVRAAAEDVAVATCDDWLLFARACYHLGNRHVALEIGDRRLCFQRDNVLEELAQLLGLDMQHQQAPFYPEPGAYANHGHRHAH
jgi:urease accessory protein